MFGMPSTVDLLSPLNLATFAEGSRYQRARHLELLEQEVLATLLGDWDVLVAQAPPRHGKSEFLAKRVLSWYHNTYPEKTSIVSSHGLGLARKHSRWVRNSVARYQEWFGHEGLDPGFKSAGDWQMAGYEGGCKAAGIAGDVMGRGAYLAVIDDYLKNAEQALSERIRSAQWEWFQTTLASRIEPGGKLIVLACLIGDTLVDMADGTRKQIRFVQPGERVLTFKDGSVCSALVRNHACVGHDDVFQITMKSGRMVTGNARHPFLTIENGALRWRRLRDLTTASRIVALKDSGESGRESCASGKGAQSLLSAEAIACPITRRRSDKTVTGLHRTTQSRTDSPGSNIATGSRQSNTRLCSQLSEESVLSAENHQLRKTLASTREGGSAWTTATTQGLSEGCSAMIATLQPDTLKPEPPPLSWLDTSRFTSDQIAEIRPAGRELVYDIEVEETASFIANGLVSHNTRWHEEDLIGQILKTAVSENGWKVREIRLPALAEPSESHVDPLGRQTDEALWPERWSSEALRKIRDRLEPYWWNSLYQQRLGSYGNNEWPSEYFYNILAQEDEWPEAFHLSATALDPSKGKQAKAGDYSAIVNVGYARGYLWVEADIERRPAPKMMGDLVAFNDRIRPTVTGIEGVAFQELLAPDYQQAQLELGSYRDEPVLVDNTVSKFLRIARLGAWLRIHRVKIRRTPGGLLLLKQLRDFPNGDHDDGPDAMEMAIRLLGQVEQALAALVPQQERLVP